MRARNGDVCNHIFGDVVTGLGSSSDGDELRLNAAIKRYFYSIMSGVLFAVYDRPFEYRNMVDDIQGMVTMFTFIETTSLLTDEGKLKFMINNTGMNEEDFNIGAPAPKTVI